MVLAIVRGPALIWRATRGAARGAALGGIVVAATVTAGSAAAAGPQADSLRLTYLCRAVTPSGSLSAPRRVPADITAAFPAASTAATPVQPTGVTLRMALPAALAAYFRQQRSGSVTATTSLSVTATQGTTTTTVAWPGEAAATDVPAKGQLVLRSSGTVPPVAAGQPGTLEVTAGAVVAVVTPQTQGGATHTGPLAHGPMAGSTGPGSPSASPSPTPGASLRLRCLPAPGQDTTLATVPLATQPGGNTGKHRTFTCPKLPKRGLPLNPRFPLPSPPPGSVVSHPTPAPGCAEIVGYSDVKKLHCAALVGPGLTNLSLNIRVVVKQTPPQYFEFDTAGQFDYQATPTSPVIHGLPPFKVTCLEFRFMPVTATLELLQKGTTNIYSIGTGSALTTNIVKTQFILRVMSTEVNGVSLPIGTHCETVKPVYSDLVGDPNGKPPYSLQGGGPLSGNVRIPHFKGCGVGEDLNTLLDATVSGTVQYGLLTQGSLCTKTSGVCPPKTPTPVRHVREPVSR